MGQKVGGAEVTSRRSRSRVGDSRVGDVGTKPVEEDRRGEWETLSPSMLDDRDDGRDWVTRIVTKPQSEGRRSTGLRGGMYKLKVLFSKNCDGTDVRVVKT